MKQPIDALVVFEQGAAYPKPVRFKIMENGVKKAVDITEIVDVQDLGAGGMIRREYTCRSAGRNGPIEYRLLYYYTKGSWEIEL